MCFSPQRRAIFPHRNFKKWSESVRFLAFWLRNALLATAACNFSTSQLQKVVRACSERHIFLKMCFSLQRRAIYQHRNFKKWSEHVARGTFFLKMCFSLQRRAIFQHRNFKKWSEHVARAAFWLKMCFSLQRRAIFHFRPERPPPHPPL